VYHSFIRFPLVGLFRGGHDIRQGPRRSAHMDIPDEANNDMVVGLVFRRHGGFRNTSQGDGEAGSNMEGLTDGMDSCGGHEDIRVQLAAGE